MHEELNLPPCEPLFLGPPRPARSARAATLALGGWGVCGAAAATKGLQWAVERLPLSLILDADPEAWANERFERSRWPVLPARIGLCIPEDQGALIVEAPGFEEVEFFNVPGGDPESLCRRHLLDAVISTHDGEGLRLTTLQRPGHDGGWHDWGATRPISYISVFPVRFDCDQATLSSILPLTARSAALVRALADAAAVLSRTSDRLIVVDRRRGRRCERAGLIDRSRVTRFEARRDAFQATLRRLCQVVAQVGDREHPTSADRAAARVASAFLCSSFARVDDLTRLPGVEAAARIAGDEPEVMLRLAAARVAAYQDRAAIDAMLRADRMLRDQHLFPGLDHLAFVQSEMEHGPWAPMTLGRVASAICMLGASKPLDKLRFLCEDLLDDMRFSSLLCGRDQDKLLLVELFRHMERVRRAETYTLPAASAAA